MLISNVIKKCKERYDKKECKHCKDCSFGNYCLNNCEVCLDYYTFLLMCQMMLQKENMTVFIWLTFIHANILADTHLN